MRDQHEFNKHLKSTLRCFKAPFLARVSSDLIFCKLNAAKIKERVEGGKSVKTLRITLLQAKLRMPNIYYVKMKQAQSSLETFLPKERRRIKYHNYLVLSTLPSGVMFEVRNEAKNKLLGSRSRIPPPPPPATAAPEKKKIAADKRCIFSNFVFSLPIKI